MSPDIFRWGEGLPRERVGAEKFGMSLETREIKLFGWDIPGFCSDSPAVPEKFEKKKVSVQFLAPNKQAISYGGDWQVAVSKILLQTGYDNKDGHFRAHT